MEFGLDQLRTGLRPGSKPNSITLSGRRQVRAGRGPVADLLARAGLLLAS